MQFYPRLICDVLILTLRFAMHRKFAIRPTHSVKTLDRFASFRPTFHPSTPIVSDHYHQSSNRNFVTSPCPNPSNWVMWRLPGMFYHNLIHMDRWVSSVQHIWFDEACTRNDALSITPRDFSARISPLSQDGGLYMNVHQQNNNLVTFSPLVCSLILARV